MTNVLTPILNLPPTVGSLTGEEVIALVQGGTTKRTAVQNLASGIFASDFPAAIEYVIDGAGYNINTGIKGYLMVPFDCTIQSATLLGNQVGDIVVDVWKCARSAFDAGITAPTSADSITGSSPPTISSTTHSYDQALSGWTTSLEENDVLAYNVVSVGAMQRVTLSLLCERSLLTST